MRPTFPLAVLLCCLADLPARAGEQTEKQLARIIEDGRQKLRAGKVTDGVIAWEKAVFEVDLKKLTRGQAVKMVEIYVRLFTVADHRRNTRHFDTYQDNALFWIREAIKLGWDVRTGAQYRKWRAPFIADVQALLKAAGK